MKNEKRKMQYIIREENKKKLIYAVLYIPKMKNRNYCFTSFEENEPEIKRDKVKYYVYGIEKAPTTGKKHYQGYIEFNSPQRINAVKMIIGGNPHIEERKGTRKQAIDYCKKGEDWREWGINQGQGARTDLIELGELIKAGATSEEIAKKYPYMYIKYHKGIQELEHKLETTKDWRKVKVIVYSGPTGTGKTRKAIKAGRSDYYKLNQNTNGTLWFDGYKGEKTLILDDFYGWIKWGELLTLLDGYKYRCQIKGGYIWAKWDKVIITSNKEPENWYNGENKKWDNSALLRRITKHQKFIKKL